MRNDHEKATKTIEWLAKSELVRRLMDKQSGKDIETRIKKLRKIQNYWDTLDPYKNIAYKWMSGTTTDLVTPESIDHYITNPPQSTRAAARGAFIRKYHALVKNRPNYDVNWDFVRVGEFEISLPKLTN